MADDLKTALDALSAEVSSFIEDVNDVLVAAVVKANAGATDVAGDIQQAQTMLATMKSAHAAALAAVAASQAPAPEAPVIEPPVVTPAAPEVPPAPEAPVVEPPAAPVEPEAPSEPEEAPAHDEEDHQ